jgi:hypothetical protein
MSIRLEVRTRDKKWLVSPAGFRSTDNEYADTLGDFCSRYGIPYTTEFVSAWAMPADSTQVKELGGGRTAWIWRNADAYGKEILILAEHVIDELSLVTNGDFQNTILEAVSLEKNGADVQAYLQQVLFVFPPEMPRDERVARLEQASARARQLAKLGDAEARLLRCLVASDKK